MENQEIIERFGGVIKEEPLSSVKGADLAPNSSVIESAAPFYAYYSEVPNSEKPLYLYLVMDLCYPCERILRATISIREHFEEPFDAASGSITIRSHVFQVIRIRDLPHFSMLRKLQDLFREQGLGFRSSIPDYYEEMGIISLNKFFYLQPVDEKIFLDSNRENVGYFEIPYFVEWDHFKIITQEVKYDTSLLFFDAGKAFLMENGGLTHLVRIYRENLTLERLRLIRARYLKVMAL
ncbi:MAG: hypothetical protein R6U64_06285 [Bacteroidales bacterium]